MTVTTDIADHAQSRMGNSEQYRAYQRKWEADNPTSAGERVGRHRKNYPERWAQRAAARRAAKRQAVPKWADHAKIRIVYEIAERISKIHGIPYDVDHIVPLVSDIVCGLHWEGNLQVLPKSQNVTKGNRYWPDMPE